MVTFKGNFTNEDLKGDTGRKDPVDEVIDILNQIGQDDSTVYTGDTGAQAMSRPRPQSAAPVNVGMMSENRGGINIPMGQSTFKRMQPGQEGRFLSNAGLSNQMDPQDNLGSVQSPFTTVINSPRGGGPFDGGNFLTSIPASLGIANALTDPTGGSGPPSARGLAGINTQGGYLGDELFNTPTDLGASIDPYEQMGDNLLGGDASTVYGINPIVKRIAEFQGYDMDTDEGVRKYLADTQQTMEDSGDALEARRKDQDRALAALAAQQQQPVDPCPEGYRLDPVSKVCVPTDDTTDTDPVKRTYDTMTRPEPNYTAATGFTVPSINLPDIFTGS
jgi:hypothetical protein